METTLDVVLVGTPRPLARGEDSAIAKTPVAGRVPIRRDGLAGDVQVDRKHHGGPEMALLFYPAHHYPDWRAALPERADRFLPGAFGENLSAAGIDEDAAAIGETWRVGSALVQVSQGRQPCWKLAAYLDAPSMVARTLANGRAGWYLRVLEEGAVAAGDAVVLVDRPDHGWTVRRTYDALLKPGADPADLRSLAALETLSPGWRALAAKRAG